LGGDKLPYIKQERRPDLDITLQQLWDAIIQKSVVENSLDTKELRINEVVRLKDPPKKTLDDIKGDVNYCFTKILVTMLEKFGTRYHVLSSIRAVPQDVHDEFEEQFMKPYEKRKREENGEILPLEI